MGESPREKDNEFSQNNTVYFLLFNNHKEPKSQKNKNKDKRCFQHTLKAGTR